MSSCTASAAENAPPGSARAATGAHARGFALQVQDRGRARRVDRPRRVHTPRHSPPELSKYTRYFFAVDGNVRTEILDDDVDHVGLVDRVVVRSGSGSRTLEMSSAPNCERTVREAREVEAQRARGILALPPGVDGREVTRDRRDPPPEVVGRVGGIRVDHVHLGTADRVGKIDRGLPRSAPVGGCGAAPASLASPIVRQHHDQDTDEPAHRANVSEAAYADRSAAPRAEIGSRACDSTNSRRQS